MVERDIANPAASEVATAAAATRNDVLEHVTFAMNVIVQVTTHDAWGRVCRTLSPSDPALGALVLQFVREEGQDQQPHAREQPERTERHVVALRPGVET
jgi:hypothetical protein